jgi:hypothetical protein
MSRRRTEPVSITLDLAEIPSTPLIANWMTDPRRCLGRSNVQTRPAKSRPHDHLGSISLVRRFVLVSLEQQRRRHDPNRNPYPARNRRRS